MKKEWLPIVYISTVLAVMGYKQAINRPNSPSERETVVKVCNEPKEHSNRLKVELLDQLEQAQK